MSLCLTLAQHGGALRVSPVMIAVLQAAVQIERRHGLDETMYGFLTAYTSLAKTLATNQLRPVEDTIAELSDAVDHLITFRDALADGRPPPDTSTVQASIDLETAAALGMPTGGQA